MGNSIAATRKATAALYNKGPVRRGNLYCAPWCGGGCTWAAFKAATARAKALADHLGDGFRPDVWENLGWHAKAVDATGTLKIHIHVAPMGTAYTAFLGEGSGGTWVGSGRTPEAAMRKVAIHATAGITALLKCANAIGLNVVVQQTERGRKIAAGKR